MSLAASSQRHVVDLDVLAGGDVALVERHVLLDHVGEGLHLLGRDAAEGQLDADHLHVGLALAVDALLEAEADELVPRRSRRRGTSRPRCRSRRTRARGRSRRDPSWSCRVFACVTDAGAEVVITVLEGPGWACFGELELSWYSNLLPPMSDCRIMAKRQPTPSSSSGDALGARRRRLGHAPCTDCHSTRSSRRCGRGRCCRRQSRRRLGRWRLLGVALDEVDLRRDRVVGLVVVRDSASKASYIGTAVASKRLSGFIPGDLRACG